MAAPLFILSFRHRDELNQLAARGGWHAIAAGRADNAEARFAGSGASVAVVDARGALEEGLSAARALADAAEANGAALLVLLSRNDGAALERFFQAGATHFLMSPIAEAEFLHALQFAERHAERVETPPTRREGEEGASWRGRRGAAGKSGSNDPLTGLGDRRALLAAADVTLGEGAAGAAVLLLISAPRYDAINAAFGRAVGDDVLQAMARRIARAAEGQPKPATVSRIAGAEFAVLLRGGAGLGEGRQLAESLVAAIGRPFLSGDHVVSVGARAGVVVSEGGEDARALLRRASGALAEARAADGAPVRALGEGDESDSARADRLAIDLRGALDRDEIEILFQPQVAVTGGAVLGVEALARWRHPSFGELGAATLFGVAERSDYLAQLSDHVQRRALEAAAAWPEALSALRVAINITAADIGQPGFAPALLERVSASGFAPGRLTVEVTESGLIEDLNGAAALLADLRAAGLRVAIDDFGTGYSSLAYLKALPLDYLKLDRKLAQDIEGSSRDRVVVRGVIGMARSLGIDVIAEGVETEAQLALLAEEGCTLYQGFLCAPPLDSRALLALVAAQL